MNTHEEIKNDVINTGIEVSQAVVEEAVKPMKNGKGIYGAVAAGVTLMVTAAGVAVYKNRHKHEERQVEKLRKKGYTIIEPETESGKDEVIDGDAVEVK